MKRAKTEDVLEDFFDLELPILKPAKRPESVFDSEVMNVFSSVDGLANSLLFKTPKLKVPKLVHKVKVKEKSSGVKSRKTKKVKNTIFFPAKHKKLSKIISIVSPEEAKKAVKKIKNMVGKSSFTRKQLRASLILAGARAKALAKKPTISSREKQELRKVAEIYFQGARTI